MSILKLAVLIVVCIFIDANSAHAYLDAGSGSMIMQILLGGLAGLAVVLKLFWHRILSLFGVRKQPTNEAGNKSSKS